MSSRSGLFHGAAGLEWCFGRNGPLAFLKAFASPQNTLKLFAARPSASIGQGEPDWGVTPLLGQLLAAVCLLLTIFEAG
jgi:hypothetical protein